MFDCTYLNIRIREFSNAQSKKREYFEKLAAYFTKRFCDIFQSFVKNTRIANDTKQCGKTKKRRPKSPLVHFLIHSHIMP